MMDEWTRQPEILDNPSYLLAAMWYIAGNGRGDRNMVIVPYSDRLILLSRYMQQLVMESLGKALDLDGKALTLSQYPKGNGFAHISKILNSKADDWNDSVGELEAGFYCDATV